MKKLTRAQQIGLDTLKALRPFPIVPERQVRVRYTRTPMTIPACIKTGVNTHVLYALRELGLIACTTIWLRGYVTPDLRIIEKD